MEDQQMYKTQLVSNSSDSLYYQQMQHQANSQLLNHSYDSLDLNASESSSSSPHLSQDSREITLNPGAKNTGQVDASRTLHWSNVGNHTQGGNNINCYDQSLQWNSQVQNDPTSGAYQMSYYPELDNHPKMTSRALHKLDSFTQVFARQNLRIHAMAQGLPEQSLADCDSALRQLLSVKPMGEQQATTMDRYPQVSQQMHPSLSNQQQKPPLQPVQQSQSFYYDYFPHATQMPPEPSMQQYGQQGQSNQVLAQHGQGLQQTRYYVQHQQPEQHRLLHQGIQQQGPFSGQLSEYYQVQSAGQEMHHNVLQSHHHHVQLQHQQPPYSNSKAEQYAQNQSHDMHLIQLGAVPQYMFQNAQPVRNSYKHRVAPQLTLHQDNSAQKPYKNEVQPPVLMRRSVGLSNTDNLNDYSQDSMGIIADGAPQRHALTQDNSYLLSNQGARHSPSPGWPQHVSDGKVGTVSPDNSRKAGSQCSVCFKEFKSLPALNGHLRSHGGVRTVPKQDEGQKSQTSEAENLTPIVMPVSVPVKLTPPDANAQLSCRADQPANSMSDDEMPILTRMTCSPTSSPKADSSRTSSEMIRKLQEPSTKLVKAQGTKPQQERRKYRHRPEPLFIPPPFLGANLSHSGATLYQSQLRSPHLIADALLLRTQEPPTYTPPPMLSPVRQGSGLFSSVITSAHNAHLPLTPLTPTPRVLLCRYNCIDGTTATVTPGPGEQTVDVEPKINIGSRFQAKIPDLQHRSLLEKDTHKATLVWKPWPDLESEESQHRVEVFLSMSCSSVLPGGGTNMEYALHSLFEANGNIMTALEMLLLRNAPRLKTHPLASYHYAGSDYWTTNEKKSFNKAINTCNKDLFHVQKMIKTKTVSQCVEYYYTWKKILHMGRRQRSRLIELHEDDTTSVDEEDGDEPKKNHAAYQPVQKTPELLHPAVNDHSVPAHTGPPAANFVCEMGNCGAIFCSRQALNGHARIHGGTATTAKVFTATSTGRSKSGTQSEYCSVKSSPAHSTTSGETDATSVFPCKLCGKVFYKIKSRNAHMKTHRQQEEQQRQKAQKAAVAAEMADTIARTIVRTTLPTDNIMPFDPFSLIKSLKEEFDDDVAQDLEDVLKETEVMHPDLILDDEDVDLLQDGDL
ncbi:transcriptional-regulating factor 1 [Bufo gargarizans]|uniref:transcriptional-regulating factor 1 n=1 Tax=Bufo gargarizans TaxID=30331 RepID=UPI001CF36B89|nr:transcriptional-regulating factor 1 [Bufo gargarizans]